MLFIIYTSAILAGLPQNHHDFRVSINGYHYGIACGLWLVQSLTTFFFNYNYKKYLAHRRGSYHATTQGGGYPCTRLYV